MIGYSILICGTAEPCVLEAQLRSLQQAVKSLRATYEVLVVGPGQAESATIQDDPLSRIRLMAREPNLRWIEPANGGAELAELVQLGLAASVGESVVFVEAGNRHVCRYVPAALARLARADFVQGKRRRHGLSKLAYRFARLPRWLLLGLDVHDPGCCLWAARREALVGVPLRAEILQFLGLLVAQQGYRVDEIPIPYGVGTSHTPGATPSTGNLWAAWQEKRRLRRDLIAWAHESANKSANTSAHQPAGERVSARPATTPSSPPLRKSA